MTFMHALWNKEHITTDQKAHFQVGSMKLTSYCILDVWEMIGHFPNIFRASSLQLHHIFSEKIRWNLFEISQSLLKEIPRYFPRTVREMNRKLFDNYLIFLIVVL